MKFRDGDVGLDEAIAQMKDAASQANADNRQAREDAMRAIGGNLSKLRQAMARQRGYDLSTVKSITDLVKRMLENGLLDDLGKAETKRILSAAANVTGRENTSKYVQKVMDIMVDNQLRRSRDALGRLLSIRGKRVDGRGIEVQGALDANGVAVLQAFKHGKDLSVDELDGKILETADRMANDNEQIAANAAIEYTGLQLAKQYVEGITESKKAETQYKSEVKKAEEEVLAGQMTKDAFKQFKEAVGETIRQLKVERVEAYNSLIDGVGGVLGLKTLYKAVEKASGSNRDIADIPGHENAYLAENRMSSVVMEAQRIYADRYMKPLTDAVAKLAGGMRGKQRVIDYMMAKHGLERNEYMRKQAAENGEETERDFAGLTALTGLDDWQAAEGAARVMVDDFESAESAEQVEALWKAVNAATKKTLKTLYDGGIISKDVYEQVRDMYEYYIPLRGWDEKTSDEVYAYLQQRGGGGNVMKKAEGRASKADDPLVAIAGMADLKYLRRIRWICCA